MKQLILVVEGDTACRDALRTSLQSGGFDVAVLYEPGKIMARMETERPELIVLSGGQSFSSGLAALNALRGFGDDLPVIMLGEQDDVVERIVALECGADDFVSKPFNVHEVLIRVRRVLGRAKQDSLQSPAFRSPFRFNGFELNFALRTLSFEDEAVPLAQAEYAVLNLFTTAPGRVFSTDTIAQRIRPDVPNRRAAVAVWVHRLRMRIERDPRFPELVRTVRAKGYVFLPEPDDRGLEESPGRPGASGPRSHPVFR